MAGLERYDNVIPRLLAIKHRSKRPRRARSHGELELALRAESPHLLALVRQRGVLLPGDSAGNGPDNSVKASGRSDRETADMPAGSVPTINAEVYSNSVEQERDAAVDDNHPIDVRTEAERRFNELAEKRERDRLKALAAMSNKEQVEKFNESLAKQPEHFDLFKVSHTK
jgi:hypothetical protein